jgi:hypothetical protein
MSDNNILVFLLWGTLNPWFVEKGLTQVPCTIFITDKLYTHLPRLSIVNIVQEKHLFHRVILTNGRCREELDWSATWLFPNTVPIFLRRLTMTRLPVEEQNLILRSMDQR